MIIKIAVLKKKLSSLTAAFAQAPTLLLCLPALLITCLIRLINIIYAYLFRKLWAYYPKITFNIIKYPIKSFTKKCMINTVYYYLIKDFIPLFALFSISFNMSIGPLGLMGLSLLFYYPKNDFYQFKDTLAHNPGSYFIIYGSIAPAIYILGNLLSSQTYLFHILHIVGSLFIACSLYLYAHLFTQITKLTYTWTAHLFNHNKKSKLTHNCTAIALYICSLIEFSTLLFASYCIYLPIGQKMSYLIRSKPSMLYIRTLESLLIISQLYNKIASSSYSSIYSSSYAILSDVNQFIHFQPITINTHSQKPNHSMSILPITLSMEYLAYLNPAHYCNFKKLVNTVQYT